jgi:GGDEF domain-containing protein
LPKPYVAPKPVVQKNLTPLVTPKPSVPFVGRPLVTPVEQVQMKAAAPPVKPLLYQPGITPTFNAKGTVVKNPVAQSAGLRTGLDYFNRYTETALSTVGAIADTYAGYAWNKDTWNIAKERIKNNFAQIWSPPALEEAGVPAAIGRAAGNALSLAGTIITTYTLGKALIDFEQQIALNARRVAYYGKLAGQNPEEAVPGVSAGGPAPKVASERSFAFTPDEMRQGVTSAMSRYGMTRQEATDLVNMFQEIAKTPYDRAAALTYQSNAKEPGFAVGSAAFSPPVAVTAPAVPTNLPAGQGDILGFVIQYPDIAVKTGVVASASAASQLATLTTQVMAGQTAVTNLQAAMTASIPNLGVLAHYADLTRQPINEVMAEQARLAVPVGQPVTTQQTVAPAPVRTAIPAQATAPVSRILPLAAEAPAISSPVATISTRQLPIAPSPAPTTQPVAAATKQPYSVDLPDGSRLTITPPAAVTPAVQVAPAEKEPWQMTQDEYMNRRPIPAMQGKLPETGTHPAVETVDGSIFVDASDTPATHVQMVRDLGIPPERLKSGGWIVDGVYEPTARSDTMKYAEQEQAKTRVEQKQVIRRALSEGKDVPSEVLASYPDLKTSPSAAISTPETSVATSAPAKAPVVAPAAKEPWEMDESLWLREYQKEHHFTPAPGSHEEYVRQALAEGKSVPPEVLAGYPDLKATAPATVAPAATQPERRTVAPGFRETVDQRIDRAYKEKDPQAIKRLLEEVRNEGRTDSLTGLKNSVAWEAVDKTGKIVASADLTGLHWANNKFGHDFGDLFLKLTAQAMRSEGIDAYRKGGDEFAALFDTQAEADTMMGRVQQTLEQTPIMSTVNGVPTTWIGWRLDYGTGEDFQSADAALLATRAELEQQGLRSTRAGQPVGITQVSAGGSQTDHLVALVHQHEGKEPATEVKRTQDKLTPWLNEGRQPTPRELLNAVVGMEYTLSESSRQMFDTKELNKLPMLQKLFRKSGTKVIGLDELASVLSSEYGINRPQGDMQADDWLAQQLVAGASKGAGSATKDLFGGEIRTRAVASTEAQDAELFGKGQPAFATTAQKNAAERGRHLQGQDQARVQQGQREGMFAPIEEVLPGELTGPGFNALNGNLGTNANVTGTPFNQPTTAGYEMNVTPSTGTTARTIAADNIQKVVLAVKDYVTTLASHPKMKESDYHAQLQDRLKQLGVPAGLFTPTQILAMYQASKGPSQLWNLTNRVLMRLNAYNTAQTLLAEALNDVPSSVLTQEQKRTLQDATLDNADFMRSLDFIDKELTKQQVTADLREKFDTMLAAEKEKGAIRLARVTQRAADKFKTAEWLAADKTLKAKEKAEAAAIIHYLENLDLRRFDRPEAMQIQVELATAGIEPKKLFVHEGDTMFAGLLRRMGIQILDVATPVTTQRTLGLPELQTLKAKVKALTDLSRMEKDKIATEVREAIEKDKEACIVQLNRGVKASDIENLRKGPYRGVPAQGILDKALSTIKDVPRWLDVGFDRQQWLLRILDGYQKGPIWSALYDHIFRADHNSVKSITREVGLAHEKLVQLGITQKTQAQQRTLPNEMVVTQKDVLLIAIYAGNPDSLRDLIEKNGWSIENIQLSIESMSKEEVEWTNYMLDSMRTLYSLISDTFSKVNKGASLPNIANYFPIIKQFDPLKGMGQEEAKGQVQDFEEMTLDTLLSYGWKNEGIDKPSFIQHRSAHGEVLLQTDATRTFFDYLSSALDYVERAPVVYAMESILADTTFKDSFIRKAGLVRWNALQRYVTAIKSPRKTLAAKNWIEKTARTARFNASSATLGGRVSKAITSSMSYSFGLVRYGPTAMLYGSYQLASDFYGSMAKIKELAPLLFERLVDPIKWEAVVDEMAQSWGGAAKFDVRKLWNLGFTVGDTIDVASSFLGQSWALARHHPTWGDEKCAYETEQDILQYHTSIKVQDRPEMWRSGELANNLVAFMGEATAQSMGMFFEAKSAWHGKTPKAKFLMSWIIFTMLMALMQKAADDVSNGRKDKNKDFWDTYVGQLIMTNIELAFPFVGKWITSALQGYPASNNIIALKTLDEARGVLTDLKNGKFGTAALDVLRTIGFAAGIPVLGVDELLRWLAPGNTTSSSTTISKPSKPTKPAPAVQKPHK